MESQSPSMDGEAQATPEAHPPLPVGAEAKAEQPTEAVVVTESKRPAKAGGHLSFALNADKTRREFRGSIKTKGTIVSLEALRENRCVSSATEHEVRISCDLQEESFRARMVVHPSDAEVHFDLKLSDEEAVDSTRFYVGRYGLAFLPRTTLSTAQEFDLAYTSSGPNFQPGFDAGVFVWHNFPRTAQCGPQGPGGAPEDEPFQGQEVIDDEATKNALKELGYWK